MKKMQSIVLALSLVLFAPMAAQAAEITLVPSVKLQIGDRDNRGYYWDGGHWRDHGWWKQHYEWRGNRWHPYGPPPSSLNINAGLPSGIDYKLNAARSV